MFPSYYLFFDVFLFLISYILIAMLTLLTCSKSPGGQAVPGHEGAGPAQPHLPGQPAQQPGGQGGRQEDHEEALQVSRGLRLLRHSDLLETAVRFP